MNGTSIPCKQTAELKSHNDVVAYVPFILLIIIIKLMILNSYVKLKKKTIDNSGNNEISV